MLDLRIDEFPMPLAVVRLPDGGIAELNTRAMDEWRYDADAVSGLDVETLFRSRSATGRHPLRQLLQAQSGATFDCEAELITGTREIRHVLLSGTVLGDGEHAVLSIVDLTTERAREGRLATDARRLRALIDANFDAYYDWHIDAGYHEWSPQMDALLELPPDQSFPQVLDAWVERLHPDEVNQVVARLKRSIEGGEPYVDEYRLRTDSGDYRLVSDRGLVLLDDAGRVSDLVGVIRDITDQRRAQVALEESEALYRTLFEAEVNPIVRTDRDGRLLDANDAALSFLDISPESLDQTQITDFFGAAAREVLAELRVS